MFCLALGSDIVFLPRRSRCAFWKQTALSDAVQGPQRDDDDRCVCADEEMGSEVRDRTGIPVANHAERCGGKRRDAESEGPI